MFEEFVNRQKKIQDETDTNQRVFIEYSGLMKEAAQKVVDAANAQIQPITGQHFSVHQRRPDEHLINEHELLIDVKNGDDSQQLLILAAHQWGWNPGSTRNSPGNIVVIKARGGKICRSSDHRDFFELNAQEFSGIVESMTKSAIERIAKRSET